MSGAKTDEPSAPNEAVGDTLTEAAAAFASAYAKFFTLVLARVQD